MVNLSAYFRPFALLLITISGFLSAQTPIKYPTLLWKISGKNLKKPSYLYGTMHVSNRVAYYLSEQFFDALKSVDVVGLETNPGEWMENMEKTGALEEALQLRSPNYYGSNFYKSSFVAAFPEKKALQGILSYDPDIINGLLYRQNGTKENFEESTYIDLFIYQSAAKLNKQLISLESFGASEIKARLAMLPDEEPDTRSSNHYSSTQKIEDAYRSGNLDLLDSLSKSISSKNTQQYLIEDRNDFFVNTIDSVLQTKSLFSGVGAAHLPGEHGVIELLRKKGYTLEPIFPKVTKKSNSYREELDSKIKEVGFTKQLMPDSAFSLNLPGKLYPIVDLGNLKYYIHADMANGSFYTVVRLKHQGALLGIKADEVLKQVDSLLFENIPGKIIQKKDVISNNGIKGLEVVNKTRRGDEQHYLIYFTDTEMILFKLGGKQSYATGSESKKFFGSISFNAVPEKHIIFSPPTGGFTVKLPANYHYTKNNGSSVTGQVEDLFAYNPKFKEFYGVQQAVYNDFSYLESDTFELNRLASNTLINFRFTFDQEYKLVKEQGFPCINFSARGAGTYFYGKIYIKGVHYYLAYLVTKKQGSFDHDLFESFKLSDFNYVNPIKEITDHSFYFKAKDEVSDNALSRFNEVYVKAYEATHKKKDTVKVDFDFRTGNKFYYSPSSNEYVNITYEKYNDYDYKSRKDLEEKIEKLYKKNLSMLPTHTVSTFEKGLYTYSSTLTDTGTVRAIKLKLFIKNGLMQEVSVPFDTTIGLKGWAKDFFESFTPLDTVIGKPVFENKITKLFEDLGSSDTTIRRRANVSVNSIEIQKEYADEFVKFVTGEGINKVSEDSRAQLFVGGGSLESEKIISPYHFLYRQYTDSFYLQLCLLKGLAYLKTNKAYDTFYSLLMSETPLVGAENTVSNVFEVLHDSLELSRKFFPGILALTKYDEYRDAVYSLMADLVNKKLLPASVYLPQKGTILMDAELALKRYNPQASKQPAVSDQSLDYLEKTAKELAESIRGNLEGLSNNMVFKGSQYLKELDSYNRPALVNYAIILSPFYKTDERSKQFFTKLAKIKTQNIVMPVTIQLLKQQIIWNDTLVSYYSKNKYTRAFFYSELEKEDLSAKFDKNYLSQQSLIESVLLSQKQLNSLYNNLEKDKTKKDSIVLVKQVGVANKYKKGSLYIYKSVAQKNQDEQWSVVFVEDSKESINSRIDIVSPAYYLDTKKTQQENINDLVTVFSMGFRKRAQTNTYE